MKITKQNAFDFIKNTNPFEYSHVSPKKGKPLTAEDFHHDSLDGTGYVNHKVTLSKNNTIVHSYTAYEETYDEKDKKHTSKNRRRDSYKQNGKKGKLVKQEYFGKGKWIKF